MAGRLTFRPIQPVDDSFLRAVYASTREEELKLVDWTPAQKEAFLRMQFDAQHRHYQTYFLHAEFSVVLWEDCPVGRLYLDRGGDEFHIIDIALLSEHRGKGLGTTIMNGILEEAALAGKPVLIHVERFNPALRLYKKLGFEPVEEGPVYLLMRRESGGYSSSSATSCGSGASMESST